MNGNAYAPALPHHAGALGGDVPPLSHRTDGTWVWTDTASYYLRECGLAPDGRLVADIRSRGSAPPPVLLNAVAVHRAPARVFRPFDDLRTGRFAGT